jgi:hypothetical protein
MDNQSPITNAVYGKGRGGPKKARKEQPRRAERLVGRMLGEDVVAELYRSLGMKRPEDRKRR